MKINEYAFITFLILVGLFLGYFVVGGVASYLIGHVKNSNSTNFFVNGDINKNVDNGKFVESSNFRENITNKIVADLSEKFIDNIDLSANSSSVSSSTLSIIDKLDFSNLKNNKDLINKISPQDFGIISYVDPSQINLVVDNPTKIKSYWSLYFSIISETKPMLDNISALGNEFQNVVNGGDVSRLSKFASKVMDVHNNLSNMSVPQSLVNFHKKNLIFFNNFSAILDSYLNYKKDPIKAYVLSQYFSKLLDDWDYIGNFVDKYAIIK